ncbi:MAG: hypothetical protein AMS26_10185 [Bacteroides sp. SM23_62]|nr:MAG: hypothetical protein AMS26_10185 [Bacteroides sp. SM23_62]
MLLLISCLNTQGQNDRRLMSIVDFINIPGVSNPQLSPDGTKLIYILSESDWKANKQIVHIWLVKANGDDAHQITFGPEGESDPLWSPDGLWISFSAKRNDDEENQIYIMRSEFANFRTLLFTIYIHLDRSSDLYKKAFSEWRIFNNFLGYLASKRAGRHKSNRMNGAIAVRKALEYEKQAINEIRTVIKQIS